MDVPATHYARSGDLQIAYQVVGEGPLDIVMVPTYLSNIEMYSDLPFFSRFYERLSSFSRLILFDRRGCGCLTASPVRRRWRSRSSRRSPLPRTRSARCSRSQRSPALASSELCGLTWSDVNLEDIDDAEITFAWQVDRKGNRRPTKTDGSVRTVPIPRRPRMTAEFAGALRVVLDSPPSP